jgi:aryl-alcohol dehydrogenase-like predicted oxidoreductase
MTETSTMERRPFGRTGLTVPVIGLGTWRTFDVDPQQAGFALQVVDAMVTHGSRFVDSSPMYGRAERVLGASLEGKRLEVSARSFLWPRSVASA